MAAAEVSSALMSIIGLIKRAALEPTLTGALVLVLSRGPEKLRQPLQEFLLKAFAPGSHDGNVARLASIVKTLRWLFALGLAARVNEMLTAWAVNHWRWRKQGVAWSFDERTKKEIAVVTGGCSGFGLLTVKGLAGKMKVVVLDVQDLPEELKSYDSVSYYKCDITSSSAVSETASAIRRDVGTPSILINNAGIATAHTILDTSEEYLEKIFRVNLLSHWITIKEFLPAMLEAQKGHILSVASMASYFTCAGLVDYAATKAGVLALHEGMAGQIARSASLWCLAGDTDIRYPKGLNQELKWRLPNGRCIQTSIVHPMWARTPLIRDWESSLAASKTFVLPACAVSDQIVKQVLSGQSGQVYVPTPSVNYSGFRGFPAWLQEYARDGLDRATKPR